jgi:hypothetical protein
LRVLLLTLKKKVPAFLEAALEKVALPVDPVFTLVVDDVSAGHGSSGSHCAGAIPHRDDGSRDGAFCGNKSGTDKINDRG